MLTIVYIILLFIINFSEFKHPTRITNSNLFNLLSIDILSFSFYMFYFVYKHIPVSFINMLSIIILLYIYNKEKYSFIKTILLIFNIIISINLLFKVI